MAKQKQHARRRPTKRALARMRDLHLVEERGPYAIARVLNEGRYRGPNGRLWTETNVRAELQRMGIYRPTSTERTSADACRLIVTLGQRGASIPETREALEALGLEPAHRGRWAGSTIHRIRQKAGISDTRKTDMARFCANLRIDPVTGCHLWTGHLQNGYGKFEVGGSSWLAHRWRYEHEHGAGSIPDGYHLHHECRQPACVNPAHLTPIAAAEHKTLEAEEDAILDAIADGRLDEEIHELTDTSWPAWPEGDHRVGARRPDELPEPASRAKEHERLAA